MMGRNQLESGLPSKAQERHIIYHLVCNLSAVCNVAQPFDDRMVVFVHPFNIRFSRFNSLLNGTTATGVFDVLMCESLELQTNRKRIKNESF